MGDEGFDEDVIANPLLMKTKCFKNWVYSRYMILEGEPPYDVMGKIRVMFTMIGYKLVGYDEVRQYMKEIGLMMPIREN